MKQTFLEQSAAHIFTTYGPELDKITVVLPTNRACYFFKRALAGQTDEPVWSPRILPVDEFVTAAADAELIDPIQLLWLLFDTCRETDPKVQFDRFTSWAHTLLQDFDHLDQYLVDAAQLFEYLSEAKTLERWQPDLPAGQPPSATETLPNYFKLWGNLHAIYLRLKEKLAVLGKGYRGMLYRRIAEDMQLLENPAESRYVFIGFNALSRSEEKIVTTLVKQGRGEMLWDTDDYYMDANRNVKAGDTLRQYRESGLYGPWQWQTRDLLQQPKDIYLIGVPNTTMQARVAMHLHRTQLLGRQPAAANGQTQLDFAAAEPAPYDSGMTAIVLPDETMLMPLLNSLPDEVKDFNVTMGLSLKNSGLFNLVESLFELHHLTHLEKAQATRTPTFSHRYVAKVLTHPFVRQYDWVLESQRRAEAARQPQAGGNAEPAGQRSFVFKTLQQITHYNKVFFTPAELLALADDHPFFVTLFTPWNGEALGALTCFYGLIDHLRTAYLQKADALELEYLYLFRQMIQRLDDILRDRAARPNAEKVSLRSFRLFLNELFKQTKIPFSGEPVSDLQIMGLLETRTLDFDTVIVLSANENTLPQGKRQQSLIPFDASRQFGLPTYRTQEAVMSYHFYRLLQQPSKIYLLYTLPSEANKSEKSRFLQQIEHELVRYNPNIRLHYPTVELLENEDKEGLFEPEVIKTEDIQAHIRQRLMEGLYPSHLNTFIDCSLKYYLAQVLRLRMEEEVGDTIGADKFGDLVHRTLETIDRELAAASTLVQKEDLEKFIPGLKDRVYHEFTTAYPEYNIADGYNHMMYKVAVRLITNFFTDLVEKNDFPVEILGLEKEISVDVHTYVHGDPLLVKLTGRIDRLDRVAGRLRVIDYKTGKVEKKQLNGGGSDQETMLLHKSEAGKVRQLWLYKYLVAKRVVQDKGLRLADRLVPVPQTQVVAGIYSLRNNKDGLLEENLQMGEGSFESFVLHSEQYLQKILHNLLDPAQPFARTPDVKLCVHCGYKKICGR